jgi:hypothetical protein
LVTNIKKTKTENIMAPLSLLRSNPFGKSASAARQQPLIKKVFGKPHSGGEGGIKSTTTTTTGTETTTHETSVKHLVRFSEKKRVRKILSRKDYTLEETKATWWTFEESQQIAIQQCRKEIKKFCARGLEGHTQIRSVAKAQRRRLAINAVLDEQMIQWADGVFDEQTIANVYYIASSSCQLWASLVGRRDHRAAEEEIHESSYKEQRSSTAPHYHDHHHEQTTSFAYSTSSNNKAQLCRARVA